MLIYDLINIVDTSETHPVQPHYRYVACRQRILVTTVVRVKQQAGQ